MKRLLGAATLALLIPSGVAAAVEQWRIEIEVQGDGMLLDSRAVCAAGSAPKILAMFQAKGGDEPDAHIYCPAILTEAAKRDPSLKALYVHTAKLMGLKDPETVRASVAAAAIDNLNSYEIGGAVNTLRCPLAFDAGVAAGLARADKPPLQPQVTDAQLAAVTKACFAADSATPTLHGYVAGARFGQTLGKSGLAKRADAR